MLQNDEANTGGIWIKHTSQRPSYTRESPFLKVTFPCLTKDIVDVCTQSNRGLVYARAYIQGSAAERFRELVCKSGGSGFKHSSLPQTEFVFGSPKFNSLAMLCN